MTMKLPDWNELAKRGIDVTLDDILHVMTYGRTKEEEGKVRQSFDMMRQYFTEELRKSQGLSEAEAFALGKPYNNPNKPIESQVDFYVMTKKGIMRVDGDGHQHISQKWEKIVKLAAILKVGTKKERRYVEETLKQVNRNTPYQL